MSANPLNFNKRVLLTGAGFSKNYGGFLAKTFRSHLLSEPLIKQNRILERWISQRKQTFETVLSELQKAYEVLGEAEDARKNYEEFQQAVYNVFSEMDDVIRRRAPSLSRSFEPLAVNFFIDKFAPKGQAGFLFTLNQDMVLEHHYHQHYAASPAILPGINGHAQYFTGNLRDFPLNDLTVSVPAGQYRRPLYFDGFLHIIKLHGSFNWKSAEDQRVMVIGGNKTKSIEDSDLLSAYSDLFKEVLNAGDVRLFVIGYSFGDPHINEIISNAAWGSGLKLFIMDTRPYDQIYDEVLLRVETGISGFIDEPFSEIFSLDDLNNVDKRIQRFFEQ
jgi:hypothetical protein